MTRWVVLTGLFLLLNMAASAHEVRPALLKITEVSEEHYLVHWKVPAMGEQRIAIDPVFSVGFLTSDDRAGGFTSGAAIRSWTISGRDLADTEITFPKLSSTMIDILVQVTFFDGRYYSGLVRPSAPAFHIPTRDGQSSVFKSYFGLGIEHILLGWDHLLFVLGMILLVTDKRRLLWAITGFTFAHSITLVLATLEVIRVPGPPVEAVIALSIVLLAVEITKYHQTGVESLAVRSPWILSVVIGLVHGLGFAGALSEYGLPGHARFISLLAFNVGVECGQLIFIAALFTVSLIARHLRMPLLSESRIATTWFIGICGSFWFTERIAGFFYL